MGWLSTLLGNPAEHSAKRRHARRMAIHRRSQATGLSCPRCDQPVRGRWPRCPKCGCKLSGDDPVDLAALEKLAALSDLERRVLRAAGAVQGSGGVICVLPGRGSLEGEIKAGRERIPGAAAVAAVESLRQIGYVRVVDGAAYDLTDSGRDLATYL